VNEDQIETALRNAPEPAPPPGLRERLEEQVRVPDRNADGSRFSWFLDWRRPLLGWAAVLVAIMVIGVQSHQVGQLRRDKEQLLKTVAAAEDQQAAALLDDRIPLLQAEIERLRRQNVELHQLRAEVARLREEADQIEPLQAEIEQLRKQLIETGRSGPGLPSGAPLGMSADEAEPQCRLHMRIIGGFAAAQLQESGSWPADFLRAMSDSGSVHPFVVHCPADPNRHGAESWAEFNPGLHLTYEFLPLPAGSDATSQREPSPMAGTLSLDAIADWKAVIARCPIHDFVAWSDGLVERAKPDRPIGAGESGPLGGHHETGFSGQPPMYQGEPAQADPSPEYYDRLMMERYGIIPTRPAVPTTDFP
jgi:hypothetical protein